MSVSLNQYCIKQVLRIELRCSEKKCVLVETVAVCEIKIVSEETINVLLHSSVLYKPHNYIKYHINILRGPINITTFIIKNYCQCLKLTQHFQFFFLHPVRCPVLLKVKSILSLMQNFFISEE